MLKEKWRKTMKLILMGPVGSGKGTQGAMISERYGIPQISTGEIFRTNIRNNTELGKIAKTYIDKGNLVPEELVNNLVADRIAQDDCKNGFILDGYPRNLNQAKALEKLTDIDLALMIDLSEDKIIERLSSRRMCSKCNQPTAIDWLIEGKCEKCGGDVYIRDDDKPEVIANRLKTNAVPKDMIDFYKNKGVFNRIDSLNSKEKTFEVVKSILDEVRQ